MSTARWLELLAGDPSLAPATTLSDFGDGVTEAAAIDRLVTKSPLPDCAVVRISGADALSFVQAQFSGDCLALAVGGSLLTAWCTPKGRVLYLPRLLRHADFLYVLLPQLQAADFCKRLKLFVLRAKVEIENLAATHGVMICNRPRQLAATPPAGATTDIVSGVSADGRQCWYLGSFAALSAQWRTLVAHPAGAAAALLADIRLGLPQLTLALSDQFLPQELNLDLLAGVSFNKGCYPGQEIVARVKFRGTVKRRLRRLIAATATLPAPATRVVAADDTGAGTVILAAQADALHSELLAVCKLDVEALALAPPVSVMLAAASLPYDLPS